ATIHALASWWEEMGVAVDHGEIQALLKAASPAASPSATSDQAATKPAPPAKRHRRAGAKSVAEWVAEASALAAAADSAEALKRAVEGFDGSPLKPLCEKTVVFDGVPGAPVMVIGEGPGGQEDRTGLPFVGKAGQLLDKMLAAISLDRKTNTFITNVNYWRPPGNRNPEADELAVCRPFVDRLIDLTQPKIMLAMGGVAAKTLLDTKTGIMRLRGNETVFTTPGGTSVPVTPMFHPAYLLRRGADKSRAWRDLLLAQTRLEEMGISL
ncbi:MAG: uracil-DNA glycosylase, partial [Pseudomonadota bacterium]